MRPKKLLAILYGLIWAAVALLTLPTATASESSALSITVAAILFALVWVYWTAIIGGFAVFRPVLYVSAFLGAMVLASYAIDIGAMYFSSPGALMTTPSMLSLLQTGSFGNPLADAVLNLPGILVVIDYSQRQIRIETAFGGNPKPDA